MLGVATENPVKREPAALHHSELVKIIVEEVLRALNASSPRQDEHESHRDAGIILFTGFEPVAPPLFDAIEALAGQGSLISALLSETFRGRQTPNAPGAVRNLPVIENARCDTALAKAIDAADWLVVPDASSNTLNKAILGIEDSVPSRAVA